MRAPGERACPGNGRSLQGLHAIELLRPQPTQPYAHIYDRAIGLEVRLLACFRGLLRIQERAPSPQRDVGHVGGDHLPGWARGAHGLGEVLARGRDVMNLDSSQAPGLGLCGLHGYSNRKRVIVRSLISLPLDSTTSRYSPGSGKTRLSTPNASERLSFGLPN